MTDTFHALRADIKHTIKTRGPLRRDRFVRAHFWRRLELLRGRDPFRAA